MFRRLIVNFGDRYFPKIMLSLRYSFHVKIKKDMVYPHVLNPVFAAIGSESHVAVDVGANVGIFSRYLSIKFRTCLAIEPIPVLAETLRKGARPNVKVIEIAAGDKKKLISITVPVSKAGDMLFALSTASTSNELTTFEKHHTVQINVQQNTIDDIVHFQEKIGFIKIDVEGYENAVIKGAAKTIARDAPIFFIEIFPNYNKDYRLVFQDLMQKSYNVYRLTKTGLQKVDLADIDAMEAVYKKWDGVASMDYLFLPEKWIHLAKSS